MRVIVHYFARQVAMREGVRLTAAWYQSGYASPAAMGALA